MKIFVQGRKRGYSVLYPFPTPDEFYNFAMDIQSLNAQNQPFFYGKFLYSIASSRGGRIYTIFVLGYDVQRSNLGNISFSVFVHDSKFIPGKSILDLLDALSKEYFERYAPDFFIKDVQENWSILTSIAEQYDDKLLSLDSLDIEHLERGTQDAAFIYYSSREQLAEFFENPYQKIYSPYSQVFFVDAEYKGNVKNPLNTVKINLAADLTEKIDLENKRYRLIVNPSTYAKVEQIHADGHRTTIKSNEHFHKKDEICIKWERQYHYPIERSGTINDLRDYLDINELNKTVCILPQNFQIITKNIPTKFLLRGEPIKAEIFKCSNSQNKEIELQEDGNLHFKGSEIYEEWTINANKGKNVYINSFSFIPDKVQKELSIKASEKKEIVFDFIDKESKQEIHSVEIIFKDLSGEKKKAYNNSPIVFFDEEIDKEVILTFKAKGYNDIKRHSIVPRKEDNNIQIQMVPTKPKSMPKESSQETTGETPKVKSSWLKQNLVSIILASLLAISLITIFNLCLSLRKYQAMEEKLEKAAEKYVTGPELLSFRLEEYSNLLANKKDLSINNQIKSASEKRDYIDKTQFDIGSWNEDSLKQSNELLIFYQLCRDNEPLVNKMQDHLKELWGNNIRNHPIKEINDTLRNYVEMEKKREAELEREIIERMSQEESFNTSQGENEEHVQNEKPSTISDNGTSTIVGLTTEQESSFCERLKKIFGKKSKK